MSLRSTNDFVQLLQKEKELLVIEDEVDPDLEIAEIQRRVVAKKGPAILFTKVKGSKFSVATNLYGSTKRIDLAFGRRPIELIQKLAETVEKFMPPSFGKIWELRSLAFQALKVGLKKESNPASLSCKIDPVDVFQVPALRSWQLDGGRFITLPLVHTQSLKNKKTNLGMYRVQFHTQNTTGMHIQIHRGGGFHHFEAEQMNVPLPTHIYVGGPPSLTIAAIAPLPEELSEFLIASLLLGEKLKVTDRPDISPLPIVSDADFVFIGNILPKVRHTEGPFGDHYGYYALKHDYPVFQVNHLFHRKDAIYPATVVGRPPQEDHYIAEYLQELLSPLFPIVMPKVISVWAYEESGVHSLASAIVKERYHKEAFTAALRILGEGHLSLSKCLVVTDERLDLKDFRSTFHAILEKTNLSTDLHIFSNISQDTLDYTGPEVNHGSKMILLGTGEKKNKLCPVVNGNFLSNQFKNPIVFCPGALVVTAPAYRRFDKMAEQLLKESLVQSFLFVFMVDDSIDATQSTHDFIWTIFTRFEPAGDIYGNFDLIRNHISYKPPIIIDARLKDWYPSVLEPDKTIVQRVNERFGQIIEKI